jgi:hypothetical protein
MGFYSRFCFTEDAGCIKSGVTESHNSHQATPSTEISLRVWKRIWVLALLASFSAAMHAADIKGTVTNATTNKPAAGDEVVVLSLVGGMEEAGRGKTDAQGRFAISIPAGDAPHLVRVIHQGVFYHAPAANGTSAVDVTVYDSARQVENIIGEGRVVRVLNAGAQQLEITEMYTLRNESNPPRTRMSDQSFEVTLPEGAEMQEAMAAGPSGMPTITALSPAGKKNLYAFAFPVRPGRTQFQVTYKLPYNGSHDFTLDSEMPLAELGVMLPKSMHFNSVGQMFQPAADENGMAVFVAKSVSAGDKLKFSIAGEGTAPGSNETAGATGNSEPAHPGGGLGAPINAPAPLSNSSWYLLVILAAVLAGGAAWLWRKSRPTRQEPPGEAVSSSPETRSSSDGRAASAIAQGGVLDAIKDELFRLETDHVREEISQEEYETAKRGLETLMRRQMQKQDSPQRA